MTQAPTPGPLTSESVKLLVKGDVIENLDGAVAPKGTLMTVTMVDEDGIDVMDRGEPNSFFFQTVAGSFRLAPTAPVEASGSEREMPDVYDRLSRLMLGERHDRIYGAGRAGELKMAKDVGALFNAADIALRSQPSGETREQLAEIMQRNMIPNDDGGFNFPDLKAADEILALLSARPLALGGQQGDVVGDPVRRVLARLCKTPKRPYGDALSTPARAEAQDEGAAGEPVAWRWRYLADPNPVWIIRTDDRSYWESRPDIEVQLLYAHPSPTPAADPVSIVPPHCTGMALSFEPGVLHVSKDGSGYIAIDEKHFELEDDRCEGPDGPEGCVHWITRLDASEVVALRDFLTGATPAADADRVRIAVEALERGIKRCETYEHIRIGGRSETAKKAGTLRNAMSDMNEALAALQSTAAKEGGAL